MARRQQSAGGMDIMGVLSNVPVALTFLLAIVGWWSAFIGQIVYEHKYDQADLPGSAVGVSWFSIFLQLAVIITLFLVLARGTLEIYRFQLTAFLSILVVFSIIGTNQGIFGPRGSQLAIGAGWLLLAIADILWLLFITADDETRLALVFSSYASEVTPNRTRTRSMMRQSRRTSSALGISSNMNNNNGSVVDFHSSQHNHGSPVPPHAGGYGSSSNTLTGGGNAGMGMGMNTYASGGSGTYGLGGGPGPSATAGAGGIYGSTAPQSLHSMPSHSNMNGNANNGYGGNNNASPMMGGGRATPVQQQQQQQQQQPIMQQQASSNAIGGVSQGAPVQMHPQTMGAGAGAAAVGQQPSSTTAIPGAAPQQQQQQQPTAAAAGIAPTAGTTGSAPPFEMKAAFSYTASSEDPNEISFVKGEIMTILDNSGKWFNARKQDGQEGIVPSNYLAFIES